MTSYTMIIMMNLRGVAASVVGRGRFVTRKAFEKSKLVNDIHFADSLVPRFEANFAGRTIEVSRFSPRARMRIIYTLYSA